MKNQYVKIGEYLKFMQNEYTVNICVKDFCGFVHVNKDLDSALRPFLAHVNPYCMYIKQDKEKYFECQAMIRKIHRKCEEKGGFFGICHAGLGEYVVPIKYDNIILGTINAGFFPTGEKRFLRRVESVCNTSQKLNAQTAIKIYQKHITTSEVTPHAILPVLEVLSEYLSLSYANLLATHNVPEISHRSYNSSEDTILSHALTYIEQNYTQKISVPEIAIFCHCSESYISHIFNKRIGVNVKTYVNKMRVELAKSYLVNTADAITSTALNSGFNDPNYFSRIFTNLVGISPTEFRRRFHAD